MYCPRNTDLCFSSQEASIIHLSRAESSGVLLTMKRAFQISNASYSKTGHMLLQDMMETKCQVGVLCQISAGKFS